MRFVKCGRVCTYLITYNRLVYHSEHFYLSSYGEDFGFKKSVNELKSISDLVAPTDFEYAGCCFVFYV